VSNLPRCALAVVIALVAGIAGCSSDKGAARPEPTAARPLASAPRPSATSAASPTGRVVVHGVATLDGKPFDARWVGAVVLRGGLVTPCQRALLPVVNGRYTVAVFADSASSGCGAPGARIVLWTFARGKILYSTNVVPWPASEKSVVFAARYSTSTPAGAAPTTAEFNGRLLTAGGAPLPDGTRVEAFVGNTRCGLASQRSDADFAGYILAVVGPESIPACARGAHLTFRINGRPAAETAAVNTPPGKQRQLDLLLR
jgi:hypothetical protein